MKAALLEGNRIEAIKRHREFTGAGLKDSKEAVERMIEALPPDHRAEALKAGKGCAGMLAAGAGIGLGAVRAAWNWLA